MVRMLKLCAVMLLAFISVSAMAEETTVLSFNAKKGDVNGGFTALVAVSAAPAPQEDLPFALTDGQGRRYEGVIPAGKTGTDVSIATDVVKSAQTMELTFESNKSAQIKNNAKYSLRVLELPSVSFYQRVNLGYVGNKMTVSVICNNSRTVLASNNIFQLRDQMGVVLAEKAWKSPSQRLNFQFMATPELEGRHDFSVWLGDYCVSETEFGSITDASRKVIQKISTEQPFMSITIDCNWYNSHADEILDVLDKYGVRCTFFMTGNYLRLFPETALEIKARGHEIGNHSNTHMRQSTLGEYTKMKELLIPVAEAERVLHIHPRLFRPPYGDFSKQTTAIARGAGMELCLWTIDSRDWDPNLQTAPQTIIRRAKKNVTPGTIVLFHLDGYNTAQILDEVIPYYQNELGLKCIPVTELMALEGYELPPVPENVNDALLTIDEKS